MKKLLGILAALVIVTSCGFGGYEAEYTSRVTFSYNDAGFIGDTYKPDSLLYDTYYGEGFTWDDLAFCHKVDKYTMTFTGGILASCLKVPADPKSSVLANNQYRANAISLTSLDNKYGVFCQTADMPEKHFVFLAESDADTQASCVMNYMYVTNSVASEQAVRAVFRDGDKLVFKATGYVGTQPTGSAEICLAEFTEAKDSIVTKWTKFDLGALGSVEQVKFEIQAPSVASISTVCIDDIVTQISIIDK